MIRVTTFTKFLIRRCVSKTILEESVLPLDSLARFSTNIDEEPRLSSSVLRMRARLRERYGIAAEGPDTAGPGQSRSVEPLSEITADDSPSAEGNDFYGVEEDARWHEERRAARLAEIAQTQASMTRDDSVSDGIDSTDLVSKTQDDRANDGIDSTDIVSKTQVDSVNDVIGSTYTMAKSTDFDKPQNVRVSYEGAQDTEQLVELPFGMVRFDKSSKNNIGEKFRKFRHTVTGSSGDSYPLPIVELNRQTAHDKYQTPQETRQMEHSFTESNTNIRSNTTRDVNKSYINIFEEQYFPDTAETEADKPEKESADKNSNSVNIFDEQHFHNTLTEGNDNEQPSDKDVNSKVMGFIDEQYFTTSDTGSIPQVTERGTSQTPFKIFEETVNSTTDNITKQHTFESAKQTESEDANLFDQQFFFDTQDQALPSSHPFSSKRDNILAADELNRESTDNTSREIIFSEISKKDNKMDVNLSIEAANEGIKDATKISSVLNEKDLTFQAQPSLPENSQDVNNQPLPINVFPNEYQKEIHQKRPKTNQQVSADKLNSTELASPGDLPADEVHEVVSKREQYLRNRIKPNTEQPETAYDLAMKIRKEKKIKKQSDVDVSNLPTQKKWSGKVDSKGYRILTDQVMDFTYQPEDVVVKILKDSIIYNTGDIVAIDKPYGLPSHGGPGIHHSIGKLLPKLAHKLDPSLETLHLVHRLDKETTGVMLLAKTELAARMLHDMFVKQRVIKKYWMLTKGVPNPAEGVIDIPLTEVTVEGKYRMALRPHKGDEVHQVVRSGRSTKSHDAVSMYRVLNSENKCALVEVQPTTGVKHQIRCHMAFGLNTPILGDHKYSHYSKVAPQKLYPEILQRLGIRQAKVRHLPMHLHARLLVLPEILDGRNLAISARLPMFFVQNMKWLKIKPHK